MRFALDLAMAAVLLNPAPGAVAQASVAAASKAPQPPCFPSDTALSALLADRLSANGIGIVVGLVDGKERRIVAAGRSGRADAPALDGDSLFQIGSVTKGFTTLLLADMVVRGEVELDDPISRYLPPDVKMHIVGREVTLRDLATHRSGLPSMPDNYDLSGEPDPYESYREDQLWNFLRAYIPETAPGAVARYSNLGVALLGTLLARRAGVSYDVLLQQRILQPLAMSDTGIRLTEQQLRRAAEGHDRYLKPVRSWDMRVMPASGSLRSTANDMLKLIAAYSGTVESTLADAMRLQLGERIATARGWQALGWGIRKDGVVVHSGGKQGFRSAVAFDPARHRGIVVLANARTYDDPMAIALHLLVGDPLPPAPPAPKQPQIAAVSHGLLDRYSGWYRFASGERLQIARKDGHILVHRPGNGISEFFPTADDAFYLDTGNDELSFTRDAVGNITGLTHFPDGRSGPAEPAMREP